MATPARRRPSGRRAAILAVGVLAAATVVGQPLGLGVALALLALGAIAGVVKRPGHIPDVDLRVAEPREPDSLDRVWWVLAAALTCVPVPARRELGRRARAVHGRRAGVAGGHRRRALGPAARRPERRLGAAAGRPGARGLGRGARRLVPRRRPGGARREPRGGAAGGLRPAADERRRGVRAAARGCRPDRLERRAAGRADRRRWRCSWRSAAAWCTRGCGRSTSPRARRRTRSAASRRGSRSARSSRCSPRSSRCRRRRCSAASATCSRPPGLTYAEYARSGFAQLLAVAALTFAVLGAARRWAPGERVLPAALCLLALVVCVSALRRLGLYEETLRLHAAAVRRPRRAAVLRRALRPASC